MNLVVDDEEQKRRLAVKAFVTNRGYKMFKEDIQGLMDTFAMEVSNMLGQRIETNDLGKLNFNVGVKSGLEKVLVILEGYEEEASL